jgi:hypothetical protein
MVVCLIKGQFHGHQNYDKPKRSKQHITSQCVYFAFKDYCPFWGPFSQKTCFPQEKFSIEMFWIFLYIVFIVAPTSHMFFYNEIWRNTNFWKWTDFVFHLENLSCNFKSYQNMLTFSSLIFYVVIYKFCLNNIYIASHLHVEKYSWTFFKS